MNKIINILIVGLGGQGVSSLSQVIQTSLLNTGIFCKATIFKGGAQKRGAVHSSIRIFPSKEYGEHFSASIPDGELDILLAMEESEALRYARWYKSDTKLIINEYRFPFYNERFKSISEGMKISHQIAKDFNKVTSKDFEKECKNLFGSNRNVNILMGLEMLKLGVVPIESMCFLEEFDKLKKIKYEDMLVLMDIAM